MRTGLLFILAGVMLMIILMQYAYGNHGYEYRLTDKSQQVRLVTEFSTYEDCQAARRIAEYFNYYATCGGSDD